MTTQRSLERAMEGASSVALKVLSAVPLQDPWSREQIVGELRRSGANLNVSVVHGCLDNLRGRGLIREPEPGRFYRTQARAITTTEDEDQVPQPQPTNTTAKPVPEVDAMAMLAAIAAQARQLAAAIEDAALEVQQKIDAIKADGQKLQALRALLKDTV